MLLYPRQDVVGFDAISQPTLCPPAANLLSAAFWFVHVEAVLRLIIHSKEELAKVSYDWNAIYDALPSVLEEHVSRKFERVEPVSDLPEFWAHALAEDAVDALAVT